MSYPPPSPPPPPPGGFGQQPGYPQPGYGAPVANQSNGMAIGALVTGLIAMLCFPVLGLVSIPLGIVAIKRSKALNGNGKGMAIAGIITGVIGIIWGIAFLALVVFAANEVDSDPSDGVCNSDRIVQDPDCRGGVNSDPSDGTCDRDRFIQDPDC
ncbi:MAG TPA: DUF4190 domain-containing protein [Acidimicrobiales bacterium]|nr:DUF4190 domain-containing protein [Acidimicrobiales bacterium]